MKKTSLTFFAILLATFAFAQTINLDSCGLDQSNQLNNVEIQFFKDHFKLLKKVDISPKSFAFAHQKSGFAVSSKKEYFDSFIKPHNPQKPFEDTLVILTEEERAQTGGYDFIVFFGSKAFFTPNQRQQLITQIKSAK